MSALIDITEAVRTAFAAAYASSLIAQNISVTRVNVNRPKLDDLRDWTPDEAATPGAIKVFVSFDDEQFVPDEFSRAGIAIHYPIMVAIAAKPATLDNENVDPLHDLREALKDFFFKEDGLHSLPGRSEGAIGIETITDVDKHSLREKGLFLAEFVITFYGRRLT